VTGKIVEPLARREKIKKRRDGTKRQKVGGGKVGDRERANMRYSGRGRKWSSDYWSARSETRVELELMANPGFVFVVWCESREAILRNAGLAVVLGWVKGGLVLC